MPPSNARRPAAQAQAQDEEQQGSTFKSVMQSIAIFMFVQWLMGQILNKNAPGKGPSTVPGSIPPFSQKPDQISIVNGTAVPLNAAPIWPEDSHIDLSIYVSSSPKLDSFGIAAKEAVKVLDEREFVIGDFNENREANSVFKVPAPVQNNGTLWAHFFVALAGHQLDPSAREYSTETAYYFSHPLTEYLPKKKTPKLKNLLSSNATEESAEEKKEEKEAARKPLIAPYYHPNVTVSIIPDSGVLNLRAMNPAMRKHVQLETTGARDASGYHGWYYPIVFLNKFWQLKTHMVEVNSTVEELPIYITLNNQKNWKFSILASMDESMKQAAQQKASGQSLGGGDGSEFEMFKEILLDTNVYLLATTGVVSVLHMVFETLAFKSDISHWRNKKDRVGTSVRSILANVVMQLIVFLYLLDNSEGTSWTILATQGFGVVLEAWKITKSVNVRLRAPQPGSFFSFLPYIVVFEDKHKLTDTEKKTKEYDEIAFKYLYIVAVPLLLAYAAYSLVYETHKSWYSFVIETLVGSVYAYGFLMMVPSLYINYRLKSVAHLPGKALTYKFLNTFIDDLFAFTIKMPTLHRLATLRDDVIFFVWLYQSYKYKVDYTRVNEFGQGGDSDAEEEEKEEKEEKEAKDEKSEQPAPATQNAKSTGRGGESARRRK